MPSERNLPSVNSDPLDVDAMTAFRAAEDESAREWLQEILHTGGEHGGPLSDEEYSRRELLEAQRKTAALTEDFDALAAENARLHARVAAFIGPGTSS